MIPYIQGVSEAVARRLSHLDVKVHMKPKHTLRSILSHQKIKFRMQADKFNVKYKIGYCDCDASNVGETSRALKTHLSEHKKTVEKADFSSSALAEHAWSHKHQIDWTNTHILNTEPCYHSRLTREAIHLCRQSAPPSAGIGAVCQTSITCMATQWSYPRHFWCSLTPWTKPFDVHQHLEPES